VVIRWHACSLEVLEVDRCPIAYSMHETTSGNLEEAGD
jgi:hypothetical protein